MADYVNPQFESDPLTIEQDIYTYIQSVFPMWDPKPTSQVKVLSESYAAAVSELIRMATDVPPEIFRYFGTLVGIPPNEASPASGAVNFTAIDTLGHTIPAGTGLELPKSDGTTEPFLTTADGVIPAGSTTVTGVPIIAMNDGISGSGLTGPASLVDVFDFLDPVVVLSAATTGGDDEETIDDYLDRLSGRLTLLADHPILPDDFVTYSLSVEGVARAMALDGYNPATGTFGNDKMISIVAVDDAGIGVPSGIKTQVQTMLQAAREVNFVVNVIDPTYTVVTIVCQVKAEPNVDLADLETRVEAALLDYLDPKNWGRLGSGDASSFRVESKVRYTNIVAAIENVSGVDYIVPGTLTINGAATDFTLSGNAPMPGPVNVATVTAVP